MGDAAQKLTMTPAEYLAFERASEERHEYAGGEIFAMSGGSREHSLASQNIAGELRSALLERPCEVHGPDLKIKTLAGKYHYADTFVLCGSPLFEDETRDVVLNPKLIVEVLSDSTERYDRDGKFQAYKQIASLEEYVLVGQYEPLVEVYRRQPNGEWTCATSGPGTSFVVHGAELRVDELYAGALTEPDT